MSDPTVNPAKAAGQSRAEIARAALKRKRNPEDPGAARELEKLRSDYRTARAAEYIAKTVEASPPLSNEQRRRLAVLLAPKDAA